MMRVRAYQVPPAFATPVGREGTPMPAVVSPVRHPDPSAGCACRTAAAGSVTSTITGHACGTDPARLPAARATGNSGARPRASGDADADGMKSGGPAVGRDRLLHGRVLYVVAVASLWWLLWNLTTVFRVPPASRSAHCAPCCGWW